MEIANVIFDILKAGTPIIGGLAKQHKISPQKILRLTTTNTQNGLNTHNLSIKELFRQIV